MKNETKDASSTRDLFPNFPTIVILITPSSPHRHCTESHPPPYIPHWHSHDISSHSSRSSHLFSSTSLTGQGEKREGRREKAEGRRGGSDVVRSRDYTALIASKSAVSTQRTFACVNHSHPGVGPLLTTVVTIVTVVGNVSVFLRAFFPLSIIDSCVVHQLPQWSALHCTLCVCTRLGLLLAVGKGLQPCSV